MVFSSCNLKQNDKLLNENVCKYFFELIFGMLGYLKLFKVHGIEGVFFGMEMVSG